MKVAFRQGIVSHQSSNFLLYNNQGKVDLRTQDRPVVVSIAHTYTDYIFTEDNTIESAWSGPFEKGTDYWLYWDFDISGFAGSCQANYHNASSCKRSFHHTDIIPVVSDVAPSSPKTGQMWYDKPNHRNYEWNGVEWVEKLRVFACKLDASSNIIPLSVSLQKGFSGTVTNPGQVSPSFIGTQIGDNTEVFAGRPLYTEQGYSIRRDDGTFFTTEDQFFADKSRVDALRLESNVYRAQSMAHSLDAFSVVAWDSTGSGTGVEDGRIRAAGYDDTASSVIGILTEPLNIGEVGAVIIQGSVTNTAWSWLVTKGLKVGDPLWIIDGVLFHKDPNVLEPSKYRNARPAVARVLADDTVVFQQGITGVYEVGTGDGGGSVEVPPATTNELGIVRLSVPAGSSGGTPILDSKEGEPVVVETTDPRMENSRPPTHHLHSANEISISGYDPLDNVQEVIDGIGDSYVEKVGDSMSGALVLNITDPSYPKNPNDAVPKKYVDKLTSGMLWQAPIAFPNLISLVSAAEPLETPYFGDVHVVASPHIGWVDFDDGNVVQYRGAEGWVLIADSLNAITNAGFPDRFGVALSNPSTPEGLNKNDIVDKYGTVVFDHTDPNNNPPPSAAVAVDSKDYPSGEENVYATYGYMWNGDRWIITSGATVNFANWIHGNEGIKFIGADPESTAENSAAIGSRAVAGGPDSIAFGSEAITAGANAIAIGKRSSAEGENAIGIGNLLSAGSMGSIVIGTSLDDDLHTKSIIIGHGATASVDGEILIGNFGGVDVYDNNIVLADGVFSIEGTNKQIVVPGHPSVLSIDVTAAGGGSLVYNETWGTLWYYSDYGTGEWKELSQHINWIHANEGLNFSDAPVSGAPRAIAIGYNSSSLSDNAIALGSGNDIRANAHNAISIGTGNIVLEGAEESISIGYQVGQNTISRPIKEKNCISIGTRASAIGEDNIAIGFESIAYSDLSDATASGSIAIGDRTIAGPRSVVIGSNSVYAPNETAPANTVVLGTRTYTNRSNTIVIGDGCYIDTTNTVSPSHQYQGEFIKIGGSAGSNMFMMMLGDPAATEAYKYESGGQFVLHAPHAQFVLPNYNPNSYYKSDMGTGLDIDTGLPISDAYHSKSGGLIFDLKHEVEYDISIPGIPTDKNNLPTEKRVKIYDGEDRRWEPIDASYLYELKDININYLDDTEEIEEGAALIFKDGIWTHGRPVGSNTGGSIEVPLDEIDGGVTYPTPQTIPIGTPMYFSSQSHMWEVAHASDPDTIQTGVMAEILEDVAIIRMSGEVINANYTKLNLDGGPFVAGNYYYLSPVDNIDNYGKVTSVRPEDGDIIAPVWQALGPDRILALPFRAGTRGEGGGAGGGGIIQVPNDALETIPPVGTPLYFDGVKEKWLVACANDILTVHTCVFAGEDVGISTLVITGEVLDVNPVVTNNVALIPGNYYYLSIDQPGKVLVDRPDPPYILAPVWQAITETSVFILPYRAGRTPTITRGREDWIADGGETIYFTEYQSGNIDVFVNGTLLHPDDYVALNGTSVQLLTPSDPGDIISVIKQSESTVVQAPISAIDFLKVKKSWKNVNGRTMSYWEHNPDDVDVFVNGILLDPSQYSTDGFNIVLDTPVNPKDVVNAMSTIVKGDEGVTPGEGIYARFSEEVDYSGSYIKYWPHNVSSFDLYLNGSLLDETDYSTDGQEIVLHYSVEAGDIVSGRSNPEAFGIENNRIRWTGYTGTTFTFDHNPGDTDVYINGSFVDTEDWVSAESGTKIVFKYPILVDDIVYVISTPITTGVIVNRQRWTGLTGTLSPSWTHNPSDIDVYINGSYVPRTVEGDDNYTSNGTQLLFNLALLPDDVIIARSTIVGVIGTSISATTATAAKSTSVEQSNPNDLMMGYVNKMSKEITNLKKELSIMRRSR